MSEADTPNNQPLPEPSASMDDSVADLPEASGTLEESQIVHISELPNFRDFVQQSRQSQTIDSETDSTESLTEEAEEATSEIPADTPRQRTNDADWFALAQKMRQRNRRLLDQVTQLKAALSQKQDELYLEQMRVRDRETVIAQQAEELRSTQEQLTRLFHTLEASHQAAQRQQILIETLSEQLQSSQERVAQLERECALTQQSYNEQSHQLMQVTNTCRELKTRLVRQQRQTLQFKVALEKSLEMTAPKNQSEQPQPQPRSGSTPQVYFPKTQPIQPWSAEPEVVEDTSLDPLWHRPIQIESFSQLYSTGSEPIEIRRFDEIDYPSRTDVSKLAKDESNYVSTTVDASEVDSSEESTDTELELEQQLLAEMSSLAEASGLLESQSDLADTQTPLTSNAENNLNQFDELASGDIEETALLEDSDEFDTDTEMLSEDLWEDSADSEPTASESEEEVILPQPNWPSPVVYPLRPPKKRKSLAAIDLPTFPRYRPSY